MDSNIDFEKIKNFSKPELRSHLKTFEPISWKFSVPMINKLCGDKLTGAFFPEPKWSEPTNIDELKINICFPRINGKQMEFARCIYSAGVVNFPWQVKVSPEMAMTVYPEVLLIPGALFDRMGHRIGRGAGHYDRYLEKHPYIRKIGLISEGYLVDTFPHHWIQSHDQQMDAIITEKEIISISY